jgi:hypothetical protein
LASPDHEHEARGSAVDTDGGRGYGFLPEQAAAV